MGDEREYGDATEKAMRKRSKSAGVGDPVSQDRPQSGVAARPFCYTTCVYKLM